MSIPDFLPPDLVSRLHLELLGSLILSGFLGAAIGVERSLSGKVAGPRTHMLIALGSALLTAISVKASAASGADPMRIPAQIVSGLGFLGAGAILQDRGRVTGLTTAAGIWVAAAVGIATAMGYTVEAIGATVFVLLALAVGGRLENRLLARFAQRNAAQQVAAELAPTTNEPPPFGAPVPLLD